MLTSLTGGLLVVVALLIPGYIHYVIRRRRVSERQLSPAIESTGLIVVALLADAAVLTLLGLLRLLPPFRDHSPNITELLKDPRGYVLLDDARLIYVTVWALIFLLAASALAGAFAYRLGPLSYLSRRFAPAIARSSGWSYIFVDEAPEQSIVHVGCEMTDGSYTARRLAGFNPEPEDSQDRDLALAPPLTLLDSSGGRYEIPQGVRRVLISARDIRRIYVSYVADEE